ncbi:hypothetical protein [Dyella amyloliquefaciens]|uniref:hypothetical protein n=1 Tax=Dyella amyloliquefaciens TaxID=1770545 RepID=UPI00102E85DF|nr:hypothetical protein [Dyella amyloliquefaciens]
MDTKHLRLHAFSLKEAIDTHKEDHSDVSFLSSYRPLLVAIDEAISGQICEASDVGLGRWELESNIRDVPAVAELLAKFELLLEGWALPSDQSEEDS